MKWTKTEHYKNTEFGHVATGHTITTEECNCSKPEPAPSERTFTTAKCPFCNGPLVGCKCPPVTTPPEPSDADKARDAAWERFKDDNPPEGQAQFYYKDNAEYWKAGWDACWNTFMEFMKKEGG